MQKFVLVLAILVFVSIATMASLSLYGYLTSTPKNQQVPFSVYGYVFCPGGGDQEHEERNKREKFVEYIAPEGSIVLTFEKGPKVDVMQEKFGKYAAFELLQRNEEDRYKGVRAWISCDPPNYPGAPEGWMRIELSGFYECDGMCKRNRGLVKNLSAARIT